MAEKPWLTNFLIVPHALGILTASITYSIIPPECINENQVNTHAVHDRHVNYTHIYMQAKENGYMDKRDPHKKAALPVTTAHSSSTNTHKHGERESEGGREIERDGGREAGNVLTGQIVEGVPNAIS